MSRRRNRSPKTVISNQNHSTKINIEKTSARKLGKVKPPGNNMSVLLILWLGGVPDRRLRPSGLRASGQRARSRVGKPGSWPARGQLRRESHARQGLGGQPPASADVARAPASAACKAPSLVSSNELRTTVPPTPCM